MIYNEIYGAYYDTVAKILASAVEASRNGGRLSRDTIEDIISDNAFSDSRSDIVNILTYGYHPLAKKSKVYAKDGRSYTEFYTPTVNHVPDLPVTELQKRWLKTLLADPRIKLFFPDDGDISKGLENVSPLYSPDDIVYFDRYLDGDPFEDENYVKIFHTVLTALREKRTVKVSFVNGRGEPLSWVVVPQYLEYSSKDDKFRLIAGSETINMARIVECSLGDPIREGYVHHERFKKEIEFIITDERQALDRVLLHFSHLEKETYRSDLNHYNVKLRYYAEDETEILIRILSFGPMIEVISPDSFIDLIKERLKSQINLSK